MKEAQYFSRIAKAVEKISNDIEAIRKRIDHDSVIKHHEKEGKIKPPHVIGPKKD